MSFNTEQKKAVLFDKKINSIVNAGAGAGKTTSLVGRIERLINKGVLPSSIFVSTFTKDSAEDMSKRLAKNIGKHAAKKLMIGTTHSLFYKILKNCRKFNRDHKKTSIIMDGKKFKFFLDLIKKFEYQCKSPITIMEEISLLKNDNVCPLEYAQHIQKSFELSRGTIKDNRHLSISHAYMRYEQWKKENGYVDFDDMLFVTYRELIEPKSKKYLDSLRSSIEYIMIDEAQDLNTLQYNLIELISGDNKNIMLILDDFQAIYGWRGSSLDNLFKFIDKHKPEIMNITYNYRCPPAVVNAANKLIKNNTKQIDKILRPAKELDTTPRVLTSFNPEEEADEVLNMINSYVEDGYDFKDICILYRTNAQARAIIDQMEAFSIPYNVSSSAEFYERGDVKDMLAYIKIIVNPTKAEPDDFYRILNKPNRYLPSNIIRLVENYEEENRMSSFWDAFKRYQDAGVRLNYSQSKSIAELIRGIVELQIDFNQREMSTSDLVINIIRKFNYDKVHDDKKPLEASEDGRMNMEAVISSASLFPKPQDFLDYVAKRTDKKNKQKTEKNSINLMTIHASKGMEFPVVFVIGMCDKIMPYYRSTSTEEREEERRLAYVAVTRAEEELVLSTINGMFGRLKVNTSPYIYEMGFTTPSRAYIPEDVLKSLSSRVMETNGHSGTVILKKDS